MESPSVNQCCVAAKHVKISSYERLPVEIPLFQIFQYGQTDAAVNIGIVTLPSCVKRTVRVVHPPCVKESVRVAHPACVRWTVIPYSKNIYF